METVWVVAADAARARVFAAEAGKRSAVLEEIADLVHPESRMHDRDLSSDLPGRAYESYGSARHAMEEPTPPKEREQELFVRRVGETLNRGRSGNRFRKLYLVAAPDVLGRLRKCLDEDTARRVVGEVHKSVTGQTPEAIRSYLPERL